jgi:hypothetical protein
MRERRSRITQALHPGYRISHHARGNGGIVTAQIV